MNLCSGKENWMTWEKKQQQQLTKWIWLLINFINQNGQCTLWLICIFIHLCGWDLFLISIKLFQERNARTQSQRMCMIAGTNQMVGDSSKWFASVKGRAKRNMTPNRYNINTYRVSLWVKKRFWSEQRTEQNIVYWCSIHTRVEELILTNEPHSAMLSWAFCMYAFV